MIKNLNDVLSLVTLIILTIEALGIFVGIFIDKDKNNLIKNENIFSLFRDYIDNTDE